MKNFKSLNCVDVTKLIMSFCVIGIHSYIFEPKKLPFFIDYFVNLAVPFFIITSGWLYSRNYGLVTNECGKFAYKYFKLYIIWVLVYFPIIIFAYIQFDDSIFPLTITFVRKLLLTGSNPFSYHLWYLLAVAVACLIIYLLGKIKVSVFLIWIIGICLLGIGYWMENTTVAAGLFYKQIFETSNNGLTFGLGAFTTGMLLYRIERYKLAIATLLLLLSIFLYTIDGPFFSLLGGASFFLFSVNINLPDGTVYKRIRSWSTWIYFIHMYPVFILMTAIIHDWIQLSRFEGWLIVSIVSLIFAYLLNKLSVTRCTMLNKLIK